MSAPISSESRLWRIAKLADICEKITDGTHHSPPNGQTGEFKYVTAKNIRPDGFDLTDITYVDAATHREIYARCDVRKDDILYVKDGATTGRVALNPLDEEFSLLSSVGVLRADREYILPRYLLYVLQAPSVRDRMLAGVAGVAITRLTLKKLKATEIPLAPLNQQTSIVAELEKQFSRLDEAVANLKRVKANLRRYTAAVLADAVEGELAGDSSKWTVVRLGDIATSVRNGISIKPVGDSGTRILRISAVRPMTLDLDDVRYLAQPDDEFDSFRLAAGDVLFTRYNGSVDLVGVCAAVPELHEPTVYPDKLIRVRVPSDVLLHSFLVIAASTGEGRAFIGSRIRTTAGQAGVSGADIKAIPLRVPPLREQHRIVAEVDRRLSIVREVEAEVDANLKRAQALRQAVLARAFAGANEAVPSSG